MWIMQLSKWRTALGLPVKYRRKATRKSSIEPHHEKDHDTVRVQPSCSNVGQTHTKRQTFENPKTKLYDSEAWVDRLPCIFLLSSGVSNVCHIACVWSTFLKLGLIPLADEIKWKLMSSPHFGTKAYSLLVCRYLANVWFCKTRTVYVVPVTVKLRPAIPQDSIANYRTILRVTPRRLSLFPLVVHQGRVVYPHPLPLTLGIAEPNPNGGCGLQECWFDKFVLLRWFDRYHACRESLTARLSHGPGFLGGGQKHLVAWALVEMPAFLTSSKKREQLKQMWSPQLI